MKVAFVHHPLGNVIQPGRHADALSTFVYEAARRLAASCEVIVYDRRGRDQPEIETLDGVQYRRLTPQINGDPLFRYTKRLARFRRRRRPLFASPWFHRPYINRIARDLQSQCCDFVIVEIMPQYPSVIRKLNPSTRIALNMQCEWLNQLDRHMVSRQLKAVDLVLGCSEYITEKARAALPEHAAKCRRLFNGCDVNRFKVLPANDSGPKRLLFMGRVSPEKGLHVLIESFRLIADRYPEAELDIVGPEWLLNRSMDVDNSDDPEIRALSRFYETSYVAALKEAVPPALGRRVHFPGLVSHDQTAKYYASAYVFVQPSFHEAFSLTLLEAMASGLPVISTNIGGIPEAVIDGQTGLLVPRNDPQALANAMSRLLGDPGTRHRMAAAARARVVANFSWERVTDELLGYLHEFAAKSGRHAVGHHQTPDNMSGSIHLGTTK